MDEFNFLKTSSDLLYAVKLNKEYESYRISLSEFPESRLLSELKDDKSKKTFWINIYNAFFQILRKFQNLEHPEVFRKKTIDIAGIKLSLDDIEHGILRKFRWKYSLGYFSKPFANKRIRKLSVKDLDFRIHFALNCGAESCPPIAFYSKDKIEEQLNFATEGFILSNSQIDKNTKTVSISKLFLWYRADFGGKKGIIEIVGHYFKKDLSKFKIKYQDYSWKEYLDNFQD